MTLAVASASLYLSDIEDGVQGDDLSDLIEALVEARRLIGA